MLSACKPPSLSSYSRDPVLTLSMGTCAMTSPTAHSLLHWLCPLGMAPQRLLWTILFLNISLRSPWILERLRQNFQAPSGVWEYSGSTVPSSWDTQPWNCSSPWDILWQSPTCRTHQIPNILQNLPLWIALVLVGCHWFQECAQKAYIPLNQDISLLDSHNPGLTDRPNTLSQSDTGRVIQVLSYPCPITNC